MTSWPRRCRTAVTGRFRRAGAHEALRIGVAIGDQVLDLAALGHLDDLRGFAAFVLASPLGLLLALIPRAIYSFYAHAPRTWIETP